VRAETAAREAAAVAVEEQRTRSWREYGLTAGVRVPRQRFGVIVQEPAYGLPLFAQDADSIYYDTSSAIPGLDIPRFSDPGGICSIDPDAIPPAAIVEYFAKKKADDARTPAFDDPRFVSPGAAPRRDELPSIEAVGWIREVRAKYGSLDVAPIAVDRFSDRGIPIAHELLSKWARRAFLNPGIGTLWLAPHLTNLVVAGALVRPDLAMALTLEHLDGVWQRDHADLQVPTALVWRDRALDNSKYEELRTAPRTGAGWRKVAAHDADRLPSLHARAEISALAVRAAGPREPGGVGAGELLEPEDDMPAAPAKKRGNR
jgi:hypothetical protein